MRSTAYCLLSLVLTGYYLSESCADIEAGAVVVDATPSQLPVHVNGGMTQRLISEIGSPIKVRAIVVDDSRVRLAIVARVS